MVLKKWHATIELHYIYRKKTTYDTNTESTKFRTALMREKN